MQIRMKQPTVFEATAIGLDFPIDAEDYADLGDFPGLTLEKNHDAVGRIEIIIDLDTRRVRGWAGGKRSLYVKVRDEGIYTLYTADGGEYAREDYVPHCLPSMYGDYIAMMIDEDGVVYWHDGAPWTPDADEIADCFFPTE